MRRAEHGTVTAELAVALPALTVCLTGVLGVGQVVIGQVQCLDGARAAARQAARGEAGPRVIAVGRRAAPSGADVDVRRAAGVVTVRVSAPVRLLLPGRPVVTVSGSAQAEAEPDDRGSGTVLALCLVVLTVLLAGAATMLGQAVLARQRAETAADLGALAAAAVLVDPLAGAGAPQACARAARVVAANGARLLDCRARPDASVSVRAAVDLPGLLTAAGPAAVSARAGPSQVRPDD